MHTNLCGAKNIFGAVIVKCVGHIEWRALSLVHVLALSCTQKVEVSLGRRLETTDSVLLGYYLSKSMYLM